VGAPLSSRTTPTSLAPTTVVPRLSDHVVRAAVTVTSPMSAIANPNWSPGLTRRDRPQRLCTDTAREETRREGSRPRRVARCIQRADQQVVDAIAVLVGDAEARLAVQGAGGRPVDRATSV